MATTLATLLDTAQVTHHDADGSVLETFTTQDAIKHGAYMSFHPTQVINEYGQYLHGRKHGRFTRNYPNGKLWSVQHYNFGELDGETRYYDETTGVLILRMQFANDLLHGLYESFAADDGRRLYSVTYFRGQPQTHDQATAAQHRPRNRTWLQNAASASAMLRSMLSV